MFFLSLFKISRPRFWTYTAGPYLIGSLFANKNILFGIDYNFLILLFIFLIPANFFIYGVNDYFDSKTDAKNPKKAKKEFKYTKNRQNIYILAIVIGVIGICFSLILPISLFTKAIIAVFYLLAFFYSAPPLRFKSIPFFDFISNSFYALPAMIGYFEFSNKFISIDIMVALIFWTGAMHLFSAISDIDYDKKENIQTTAVFLGKKKSLILCSILWSIFAIIVASKNYIFVLSIIYPIIPIYLTLNLRKNINKFYWSFPYLNTILGFLLFVYAITRPIN